MPQNREKVILDTNLWISFLLSGLPVKLISLLDMGKVSLIFSKELHTEFLSVARRPKLKKFFSIGDIQLVSLFIESHGAFYEPDVSVSVCRDEKDNFLLELALCSKADYLITGDKDLLLLKRFKDTQIITLTEYLSTWK